MWDLCFIDKVWPNVHHRVNKDKKNVFTIKKTEMKEPEMDYRIDRWPRGVLANMPQIIKGDNYL